MASVSYFTINRRLEAHMDVVLYIRVQDFEEKNPKRSLGSNYVPHVLHHYELLDGLRALFYHKQAFECAYGSCTIF